jgi:hypothetical protein
MGRPLVTELEVIYIPHDDTGKMVKIDLWKRTATPESGPVVYQDPSILEEDELMPISKEVWMKLMIEDVPRVVKEMTRFGVAVFIENGYYFPIEIHFTEPINGYDFIIMSPFKRD